MPIPFLGKLFLISYTCQNCRIILNDSNNPPRSSSSNQNQNPNNGTRRKLSQSSLEIAKWAIIHSQAKAKHNPLKAFLLSQI